jgi:hypothetical protein
VKPDPNKPWEWTLQSNVKYDDLTLEAIAEIYTTRRTPTTSEMSHVDVATTLEEVRGLIAEIQAIDTLPFCLDNAFWRRMIWVDDL